MLYLEGAAAAVRRKRAKTDVVLRKVHHCLDVVIPHTYSSAVGRGRCLPRGVSGQQALPYLSREVPYLY